ncbi:hypothetical protein C824_003591 [Schaedlerella arabinosiphila]|nr:hypothetical protein C824_003591 [Schaedlerella arabinosiphila]
MIDFYELKDLCIDIIDCPHSTPKWLNEGIPVIRNYNISGGQLDLSKLSYVDEETYKSRIKRAKPIEDDIIISREAPMGEVCLVPPDFKCCLGQRLVLLKVDKEKCNPHYLLYALLSPYVQAQIRRIDQTGSIVSNLNIPDLKKLVIPYIKENQNNIARCLEVINKKIFNNNKINEELESMAKTIYDYWFLQFEFPNEEGKPYKSSGGKMIWNEELKREIPEGWEIDTIGKHINIDRGISYSSDDLEDVGIPLINLSSFNIDATYKPEGLKTYSGTYSKEKVISPFDLVICVTQQTAIDLVGDTDVIGKTFLVPDIFETKDIVASMDVIKIQSDDTYGKYYLNRLINTKFFHRYISGFATGTKIKHLDIKGLLNYKCETPNEQALKKFNDLMECCEKKKSKIFAENQELTALRDFLLPLLMNGQVGFKD